MTTDPRAIYKLTSNPSNALQLNVTNGVPIVTALRVGQGEVTVSFAHDNATAKIVISVVKVSGVALSSLPFPAYSGSSAHAVQASNLRLYAFTSPAQFQQAILSMTSTLSDGSVRDISDLSVVRYIPNPGGLVDIQGAAARSPLACLFLRAPHIYIYPPSSTGRIVAPRGAPGQISIVGQIHTLATAPLVTRVIVSTPAIVTQLTNIQYPQVRGAQIL